MPCSHRKVKHGSHQRECTHFPPIRAISHVTFPYVKYISQDVHSFVSVFTFASLWLDDVVHLPLESDMKTLLSSVPIRSFTIVLILLAGVLLGNRQVQAQTAPTVQSAVLVGSVVRVTFTAPVTCGGSLAPCSGFSVNASDPSITATGALVENGTSSVVDVQLSGYPTAATTLTLLYSPGNLTSANGSPVASFTIPVTNGNNVTTVTPTPGPVVVTTTPIPTSLSLSPATTAPGTVVDVSGGGFGAYEAVAVTYNATLSNGTVVVESLSVTADPNGSFNSRAAYGGGLSVPATIQPGSYTVTARGQTSTRTATTTLTVFSVTPTPVPTSPANPGNPPGPPLPPPPPPATATATPLPTPTLTPTPLPTPTPATAVIADMTLRARQRNKIVSTAVRNKPVKLPVTVTLSNLPTSAPLSVKWLIVKNGTRQVAHHGHHLDLGFNQTGTFAFEWSHTFKYGGTYTITATASIMGVHSTQTVTVKVPYK